METVDSSKRDRRFATECTKGEPDGEDEHRAAQPVPLQRPSFT
jgi:hypothetical protein